MPQVKFLKGFRKNLASAPLSNGTIYFTEDERKLYIDTATDRLPVAGACGKIFWIKLSKDNWEAGQVQKVTEYYEYENKSNETSSSLKDILSKDSMLFIGQNRDSKNSNYPIAFSHEVTIEDDSVSISFKSLSAGAPSNDIWVQIYTPNPLPAAFTTNISIAKTVFTDRLTLTHGMWTQDESYQNKYVQTLEFYNINLNTMPFVIQLSDDSLENIYDYSEYSIAVEYDEATNISKLIFISPENCNFNVLVDIMVVIADGAGTREQDFDFEAYIEISLNNCIVSNKTTGGPGPTFEISGGISAKAQLWVNRGRITIDLGTTPIKEFNNLNVIGGPEFDNSYLKITYNITKNIITNIEVENSNPQGGGFVNNVTTQDFYDFYSGTRLNDLIVDFRIPMQDAWDDVLGLTYDWMPGEPTQLSKKVTDWVTFTVNKNNYNNAKAINYTLSDTCWLSNVESPNERNFIVFSQNIDNYSKIDRVEIQNSREIVIYFKSRPTEDFDITIVQLNNLGKIYDVTLPAYGTTVNNIKWQEGTTNETGNVYYSCAWPPSVIGADNRLTEKHLPLVYPVNATDSKEFSKIIETKIYQGRMYFYTTTPISKNLPIRIVDFS